MEEKELLLLEKYAKEDPELQTLWDEHKLFEKQLAKLEGKAYRTPAEEQQVRELKKQKLDGKTKMVIMLDRYKQRTA